MSVEWISCVALVLTPLIGVGGAAYCDSGLVKESPFINMCQQKQVIVPINTPVYLDTTGAPNHQAVECKCEIGMSKSGSVGVKYRSTGNQDCGIKVEYGHRSWACTSTNTPDLVSVTSLSQITFTKLRTDISDWSACVELKSAFSSLDVVCHPYTNYTGPPPPEVTTTTAPSPTSTTTVPSPTSTTTAPPPTSTSTAPPPTSTTTTQLPTSTTPIVTTASSTTTSSSTTKAGPVVSNAPGDSTTSTQSPSSSSEAPRFGAVEQAQASVVGPVLGGVIAFLVLVVFIVIIVCLVRRRRKKEKADKIPVSFGPRSMRYSSMGDDVQVTENELYNYDGEAPSAAVNALFIGGIPDTPGANPSHIPHFTTDTGDRYAVIDGSTKTKKPKDRPSLSSFGSPGTDIKSDSHDTDKDVDPLCVNMDDDDKLPNTGVDNIGYDSAYLSPKDASKNRDEGARAASGSASSSSPYDYIDNAKLQKDDEVFEKENQNHYVKLPEDKVDEPDNERYKKFITTSTSSSTGQGEEGLYNEI